MTPSPEIHPLVRAAGEDGRFPDWARCSKERRDHVDRVAELMERWGSELELDEADRVRWCAAAVLHDALREASAEELRFWTDRDWDLPLLHGPACAARLREEGVGDEELLEAVAHHTVGRRGLGRLGRFLYLADFLEPGRDALEDVRERLRALLPGQEVEALLSVVALRIAHRLEVRGTIHPDTVAMWNGVLEREGEEAEGRPVPTADAPGRSPASGGRGGASGASGGGSGAGAGGGSTAGGGVAGEAGGGVVGEAGGGVAGDVAGDVGGDVGGERRP